MAVDFADDAVDDVVDGVVEESVDALAAAADDASASGSVAGSVAGSLLASPFISASVTPPAADDFVSAAPSTRSPPAAGEIPAACASFDVVCVAPGPSAGVATGWPFDAVGGSSSHQRSIKRDPLGGGGGFCCPSRRVGRRMSCAISRASMPNASIVETTASLLRSRSSRRFSSARAASIARASPGRGGSPASARFSARSARISTGLIGGATCAGLAWSAISVDTMTSVVDSVQNTP